MTQKGTGNGRTEKVSAYVEPDVKAELEALAEAHQRSVAGELRLALIAYLERERNA